MIPTISGANVQRIVFLAGCAQVTLALGSLAIPRALKWRLELAKTGPLTRQMFWTYAGYIFAINLSFGLISVFDRRELLNSSHLSILLCGFIAIYWISRVAIQFFYFDRSAFPAGNWNRLAEVVLVTLFILLSLIYSIAFYFNLHYTLS